MNPQEISDSSTVPLGINNPQIVTNFVMAPAPITPPAPSTMETLGKFMFLLNERWPIVRTANFNGNHSIVYDTTGLSYGGQPKGTACVVVCVWIFKQLEWRNYPIGLTEDDLRLDPHALLNEIARVLDPETEKLIVPASSRVPARTA
jgi:hypothetical protein